ncbi:MAG TPA: hypothetical protein VG895_01275 [Patescibacteria group bacterium]|nr:hypothetical protein [Patescibacteria group bacterium]
MSPKLERFSERLGDLTQKAINRKTDALKTEAHRAIDENNYGVLNSVTGSLASLDFTARARLEQILSDYTNFIQEYGINEEDFNLEEFMEGLAGHITSKETIQKNTKVRPFILSTLIMKNNDGTFKYRKEDIVVLASDKFNMPEEKATRSLLHARLHVKDTIEKAVIAKPEIRTVRDFRDYFERPSKSGQSTLKDFYENAATIYGEYLVTDFIDQVLYRREPDKTDELTAQIEPIHEIRLSTALLENEHIEKIESLFNKGFGHILIDNGWSESVNWETCVRRSQEAATKKRPVNISDSQKKHDLTAAREFIENYVEELTINRNKYSRVMDLRGHHGFKVLYCLSGEFVNRPDLAAQLLHILFPTHTYELKNNGEIKRIS